MAARPNTAHNEIAVSTLRRPVRFQISHRVARTLGPDAIFAKFSWLKLKEERVHARKLSTPDAVNTRSAVWFLMRKEGAAGRWDGVLHSCIRVRGAGSDAADGQFNALTREADLADRQFAGAIRYTRFGSRPAVIGPT